MSRMRKAGQARRRRRRARIRKAFRWVAKVAGGAVIGYILLRKFRRQDPDDHMSFGDKAMHVLRGYAGPVFPFLRGGGRLLR